MIQQISQQSLAKRFDHLREVIASPRFLQMRGLNNDLPFYICEFKASEAFEIQRMRRQLVHTLADLQVGCLQGQGVKVPASSMIACSAANMNWPSMSSRR